MTETSKKLIAGIDLGTTNSLISLPDSKGTPFIVPNERGERITPSVVTVLNDKILVGQLARSQAVLNHEITVISVKRYMGKNHAWSFQNKEWTPETISSEILKYLKEVASAYAGETVSDAVITVPAYFNDQQREATLKAGELAGFKVHKLFNEPTAAALAYGLQHSEDDNLLVFDFGGGTLDITLMEVKDGAFLVKGVGGHAHLGGNDFDEVLVNLAKDEFKKIHDVDLLNDPVAMQQLLIHAERSKIDLSSVSETRIMIPYITVNKKGPLHLNMPLTRSTFDTISAPLLKKIRSIIEGTLSSAGLEPKWVKSIVLVGGTSRIKCVRNLLAEIFPEDVKFKKDLNPEEIVAMGAGLLAGAIGEYYDEVIFSDVVPHDLGVEDNEGRFVTVIPKGTPYPVEKSRMFTTTMDEQSNVTVHILQGGDKEGDYSPLGHFIVENLPKLPSGEPDIFVTFRIDSNGILRVRAEERISGINHEIQVKSSLVKVGHYSE
ncbi:MAG: Hsp70 family protein [Desulfobacterales bacterium]|nr:Hsp70 family protein [Desulfobacterales bacterium]